MDWSTAIFAGAFLGAPCTAVALGVLGQRWIEFKEKKLDIRFKEQNRRIAELRDETEALYRRMEELERVTVESELSRIERQRIKTREVA